MKEINRKIKPDINLIDSLNIHHPEKFQLDNGIVTAVSDTKENFFIGKGICKIIDDKVTILCPFCKRPEDIDVNREKDLVEKISKKLADKNITLDESEKLHKELQTARQMIQITQKD